MTSEKTILFPTDFSHTGDAAFEMAESLAKDRGAKLLIVHVEEPAPIYGEGELYYGALNPNSDQMREMLEKIVPNDPDLAYELV